jgi:hypothetical protein
MNCLLKHIIEGKIKENLSGKDRRGRRRTQLLEVLKETRIYCKLKGEALNRTSFGRDYGSVGNTDYVMSWTMM